MYLCTNPNSSLSKVLSNFSKKNLLFECWTFMLYKSVNGPIETCGPIRQGGNDEETEDGCTAQDVQTTAFHALILTHAVRNQDLMLWSVVCDCLCACACERAATHGGIQTDISAGSMHDCCWEGALSSPLSSHYISLSLFPVSFLLLLSPTFPAFPLQLFDHYISSCPYCLRT